MFLPQCFNGNRLTETKAGKIPVKDIELLLLKDLKNWQFHFNNSNICNLSGKANYLGMKAIYQRLTFTSVR